MIASAVSISLFCVFLYLRSLQPPLSNAGTQILNCRFDALHIGTIQQVKKVSATLSQYVWD